MRSRPTHSRLRAALLALSLVLAASCSDTTISSCPLPEPFCGTDFPLNTEETTPYGPPWANVTFGDNEWAACFGPYALCYYANCQPSEEGSTADCPCYDWFGTSYVQISSILNLDAYQATLSFCDATPGICLVPNTAPVCEYINSGTFMSGATRISTFSFYRAVSEPIGFTSCVDDPGLYAGCMTSPCFGSPVIDPATNTASISCDCPTFDGPYQVGQSGLSCDDAPLVYSAAYNPDPSPPSGCDIIPGCVPDAQGSECGCPLYDPGTTMLPPDSGVDCNLVCEQYARCTGPEGVELGYTCDATLCTSDERALVFTACDGLQSCNLGEVFKAEAAAGCSCCATQLCGCEANPVTDAAVAATNAAQRAAGETPQCDINGTLCGLPQAP
jgi:hypothetical protein